MVLRIPLSNVSSGCQLSSRSILLASMGIDKTGSAGEENRFSLRIRLQPFPSCLNVLALLVSQDDVLDTSSAVGL